MQRNKIEYNSANLSQDSISDIQTIGTDMNLTLNTNNFEYKKQSLDVPVASINRALMYGYEMNITVIHYLLFQFETVKYEDERCKIAKRLFDYLNMHPTILIYEPTLRDIILDKMIEFHNHINDRIQSYKHANYSEALHIFKLSASEHIRHSKMRSMINSKLNEIADILNQYEKWMTANSLRKSMMQLRKQLDQIKMHPDYVQ